jgi:hypothetical protein
MNYKNPFPQVNILEKLLVSVLAAVRILDAKLIAKECALISATHKLF